MASSSVPAPDSAARAKRFSARPLASENKALRASLDHETAARQRLELALAQTAAAERMKLAQTLHDTICQSVTAIYLMSKVAEINLKKTCPQESRQMEELSEIIHNVAEELRHLTSDLRSGSTHIAAPKAGKAAAKGKTAFPSRSQRAPRLQ